MSDNYEPIIYTLTDEEGKEQQFEILDFMEHNNQQYCAMIPYYENDQDINSDENEFVILKIMYDNDEQILVTIDDEDEYEEIGNIFVERLSDLLE